MREQKLIKTHFGSGLPKKSKQPKRRTFTRPTIGQRKFKWIKARRLKFQEKQERRSDRYRRH